MNRKLLALALIFLSAASLYAYRPYGRHARSKASWMTISSLKSDSREYYLEVDQEGKAIMREETPARLLTRRGEIKKMLVKDFFREIENSEIINAQDLSDSKMVFYRGDILKVSAYISGELTRTEAPLNKFGEAFSYALGEVRKAVGSLPKETKLRAFIRAEPVTGDALNTFRLRAGVDGEVLIIETSDIMKVKPLMAAIKEPYRMIPVENEAALNSIQEFITDKQLYGLRTLFYVPSTRGTFRCEVLDAFRKQLEKPSVRKKKKPVPSKRRPGGDVPR